MHQTSVNTYLYKDIEDDNNVGYGKIVDMLLDINGNLRYFIVSLDTSLTTAENLVYTAIPWFSYQVNTDTPTISTRIERPVLNDAPRFSREDLNKKGTQVLERLDIYYNKTKHRFEEDSSQKSTDIGKNVETHQAFEGSEQLDIDISDRQNLPDSSTDSSFNEKLKGEEEDDSPDKT